MVITENKYKISYNIPVKAYNYYKENNISFSEIANIGLNILRTKASYKEIEDMKNIVKEDILQKENNDTDIEKINEKVKELEKKIVDIIENK